MSRAAAREGIEVPHRIRLAEGDLDRNDAEHERLWRALTDAVTELKAEIKELRKEHATDSASSRRILVSVLSSLIVAVVLLALNLIIVGSPG